MQQEDEGGASKLELKSWQALQGRRQLWGCVKACRIQPGAEGGWVQSQRRHCGHRSYVLGSLISLRVGDANKSIKTLLLWSGRGMACIWQIRETESSPESNRELLKHFRGNAIKRFVLCKLLYLSKENAIKQQRCKFIF